MALKIGLALAAIFAVTVAGTALAIACRGGSPGHGNAGYDQYHHKPGCGPWKSDGKAGKSGVHQGQPPKDQHRGDCPKPPCDDKKGKNGYSSYGSGYSGGCCAGDKGKPWSGTTTGQGSGSSGKDGCWGDGKH